MRDQGRIAIAARLFAVVATVILAMVERVPSYAVPLLLVFALACVAAVASQGHRLREPWIAVAEGILVATIAACIHPGGAAALPYLVLPLLNGGFFGRTLGLLRVLLGEIVATALCWTFVQPHGSDALRELLPWLLTGLGVGLLGVFMHDRVFGDGAEASYRDAISLIRQLKVLSDKLTGGLDPVSLAGQMLADADLALPVAHAVVYTRSPEGRPTPVRYTDLTQPGHFADAAPWVADVWHHDGRRPLIDGKRVLVPLTAEHELIGALVLDLTHHTDQRALTRLSDQLAGPALQLHAALLFDGVRARATSDERNRLAREMHDGVAQDVASLGYLVDSLESNVEDPRQLHELQTLRAEVTRVVAELRASVYDLRHEVRPADGLGHSLSEYAHQIGARSDLTVHLRLDEGAARLRPEVEAELLRIAQEAMNNARKHSGGRNLWVTCVVRAPYAELEVVDDGTGPGEPRPDSHGLRIMRERALHLGATLVVEGVHGGGTRLTITLGQV